MFLRFDTFQTKLILDATRLVKFWNRLGSEGLEQIEAVLFKTWGGTWGWYARRRSRSTPPPNPKILPIRQMPISCTRVQRKLFRT
jgi:hypothetical protein